VRIISGGGKLQKLYLPSNIKYQILEQNKKEGKQIWLHLEFGVVYNNSKLAPHHCWGKNVGMD
jgi:hypothetical protein